MRPIIIREAPIIVVSGLLSLWLPTWLGGARGPFMRNLHKMQGGGTADTTQMRDRKARR